MESLGSTIRKLREDKEMPLRKVAAYLDIDQAILSKIERGQRKATRNQVVKLEEYFKVKEDDLLVAWLSDKLVYELEDEKLALKALQLAEEKVAYNAYKKTDRKTIEKTIKDYFEKDSHIRKAWLFGSFARGDDDYKSDIDIAIKTDEDFSYFDLAEIQFELENIVKRKVDIGFIDSFKPSIIEHVNPDLILIYERQPI
ncbi:MAG: nucleotidyltransferase domain-containing protein [Bacteroidia bacterium]|nr:nucleotidyltransferase domain-containing protein [Bacteroidia bacterium]